MIVVRTRILTLTWHHSQPLYAPTRYRPVVSNSPITRPLDPIVDCFIAFITYHTSTYTSQV